MPHASQWLIFDLILPTRFLEPSLISDPREVPYLSPAPHSSEWQSFSFLCSCSCSLTSQNSTKMTAALLTNAIVWVKCKYSCTLANLPYLHNLKVARVAALLWSWKEKRIHAFRKHLFGLPLCFLQVWSDLNLWSSPLTILLGLWTAHSTYRNFWLHYIFPLSYGTCLLVN